MNANRLAPSRRRPWRAGLLVCATAALVPALAAPAAAAVAPTVVGLDATSPVRGAGDTALRIVRQGDTSAAVSVRYTTGPGTAAAGLDYRPVTGIVTIPAGQRSVAVAVPTPGRGSGGTVDLLLDDAIAVTPSDTFTARTAAAGPSITRPSAIVTTDVDGDGVQDVVVSNTAAGRLEVLLNRTPDGAAAPVLTGPVLLPTLTDPGKAVACDLNNDGRTDLAAADLSVNQFTVHMNASTTAGVRFVRTDVLSLPFGYMNQMACADFDGDGRLDLVGANSGSSVSPGSSRAIVFRNITRAGAAVPRFDAPLGLPATADGQAFANTTNVVTGDLNNDGRTDIAVSNGQPRNVSVLLNTTTAGSAALTFTSAVSFTTGESAADLAIADITGDGRLDLVTTNSVFAGGATWALLVNATPPGSLTPRFRSNVRFLGGVPFGLAISDVDLDGRPDAVVTLVATGGSSAGSLSVLLNRTAAGSPDPTFIQGASVPAGDEPQAVAIADLTGDTVPDLITGDTAFGGPLQVSVQTRVTTPVEVSASGTLAIAG